MTFSIQLFSSHVFLGVLIVAFVRVAPTPFSPKPLYYFYLIPPARVTKSGSLKKKISMLTKRIKMFIFLSLFK